jgi:hypothetical protein
LRCIHSYITYITEMVSLGRAARQGLGLVPASFNASPRTNHVLAAFGILGIICYSVSLIGTLSLQLMALLAFQSGKPQSQKRSYYKSCLIFFSGVLAVAGLTQLVIGCYVLRHFGKNFSNEPVVVSFYIISLPGIAVFVGLIQLLAGLWGMARPFTTRDDYGRGITVFQATCWFVWFCQIVLQVFVQPAYQNGEAFAGNATQVLAFSFFLAPLPAFLDYKSRSTAEVISAEYYSSSTHDDDHTHGTKDEARDIDVEHDTPRVGGGGQHHVPGTREEVDA